MLKKKNVKWASAAVRSNHSAVDFNGTYLLTTVEQEELWILHMHIALVEKLPLTTSGSPVRSEVEIIDVFLGMSLFCVYG